jgi:hypothetical protein
MREHPRPGRPNGTPRLPHRRPRLWRPPSAIRRARGMPIVEPLCASRGAAPLNDSPRRRSQPFDVAGQGGRCSLHAIDVNE